MVTLSIKSDFKQVQNRINTLSRDVKGRVISAALNKVASKAKTAMDKEIRAEFNIAKKDVSSKINITKAQKKIGSWQVTIEPLRGSRRGRGLNLIQFVKGKIITQSEARRRKKPNLKKYANKFSN